MRKIKREYSFWKCASSGNKRENKNPKLVESKSFLMFV
jgi:hypothetical protein